VNKLLSVLLLLSMSCHTGSLTVIGDLPNTLKEVSGTETIRGSDLIWMNNDSGNSAKLYGVNSKGEIINTLNIDAKNKDWEDLTSDEYGNLYIGDFGNNSKKRKHFNIIKVNILDTESQFIKPLKISFTLPKDISSKDFEAFFLFNDFFYLFSKESKKFKTLKIPNIEGEHVAKLVSEFNFNEKREMITSADISNDGKTIVLLNHDKVWVLTDFKDDHFFSGTIKKLPFEHISQKEGVAFKDNNTLYITDESARGQGGNLYEFSLN